MKETGIDISQNFSKSYDHLSPKCIVGLDYIITLCAEEVCPTMAAPRAKRPHCGFTDPAKLSGSRDEQLSVFREVRDGIRLKIEAFAREIEPSKD